MASQNAERRKPRLSSQYSGAGSRPVSATYIPRPVSGTSRKASSVMVGYPLIDETVSGSASDRLISPNQTQFRARMSQKSSCNKNSMPPTSYPMPNAMLPRSDSLLPYRDRTHGDLSGMQQSLHVKNYSTQPIDSPANISASSIERPHHLSAQGSNHFAKSFSRRREITPRMLLKPIQPLVRSQTAGQLGCFGDAHTISPSKPARKSSIGRTFKEDSSSQLDVVDALLESRMTKHEIKTLDQVREEAITNQSRLISRTNFVSGNTETAASTAESPLVGSLKTPISINLSINDVVNTQKLKEQQRRMNEKRALFINTALANTANNYRSSDLSSPTPTSDTTRYTVSSSGPSPDPRNVYVAEDAKYWIGRYISTADRMRKRDCDFLLKPGANGKQPININSTEFEEKFDKLEESRSNRVLKELRQCCKTQSATKSFARFEIQFKRKLSKPPPVFVRSCSEIVSNQTQAPRSKHFVQNEVTGIRHCSGNNATSQLSTFNAHATIEKLSGLVGKRGGLVKSKTTGDLALKPISDKNPTPGLPGIFRKNKGPSAVSQTQAMSHGPNVSEARARALGERQTRPISARGVLFQASDPQTSQDDKSGSKPGVVDAQWPLSTSKRVALTNTVTSSAFICPGLTVSALESGHGPPPPRSQLPAATIGGNGRSTDNDDDQETIVYQKKRGEYRGNGPSSGEFVKKVVGVGMCKVRKMSRRVGGLGWSNSSDELPEIDKMV